MYITKPFSNQELIVRIENVFKNRSNRNQIKLENLPANSNQLVLQIKDFVLKNISDSTLSVKTLAKTAGYSERQLRRILKAKTGLSPVAFILEIRLITARSLLENKKLQTVSEVQYAIGLESASYFSKVFAKRFGRSPMDFLQL